MTKKNKLCDFANRTEFAMWLVVVWVEKIQKLDHEGANIGSLVVCVGEHGMPETLLLIILYISIKKTIEQYL